MSDTLVQLTDSVGKPIIGADLDIEPNPASIVLTEGEFGTLWQRFFSDGLWHCVRGGRPRDWAWLCSKRNLVLVYDAKVRR